MAPSDDASDMDILCDALNEMEHKLAIAKSLHHILDDKKLLGRGDDVVPAFRLMEVPHMEGV